MTSTKGRLALLWADVLARVRRSRGQRAEILAAYDQSGVNAAELALLVGVKYPTLAGWLHRRCRPGKAPAMRFVEAALPTSEAPAPVELELPGGLAFGWFARTDIIQAGGYQNSALTYPEITHEEIFKAVERFYHRWCFRSGPILRIVKTMLSDRDVCVRRLREGYAFFRSMSERQW